MKIEQALYGERRGGHSLLVTSGDGEVPAAVVQRLDLPDTAPPGVEWSPFLRGFPYEDKYVLARTFYDTRASRGGMVFSHALFVPLADIIEARNLGPVVGLLASSDLQRPNALAVEIGDGDGAVPQSSELMEAAEALGGNQELPVVRLGHLGFDDLVVALWAHLRPDLRRNFAFRLSFDPRDVLETPRPALVCTPRGMAGRWSEQAVIGTRPRGEPTSLVAAILSGHWEGGGDRGVHAGDGNGADLVSGAAIGGAGAPSRQW